MTWDRELNSQIKQRLARSGGTVFNDLETCTALESDSFEDFVKYSEIATGLKFEEAYFKIRCDNSDAMFYVVSRAETFEDFAWDIQDYFTENADIDNRIFTRILTVEMGGQTLLERFKKRILIIKKAKGAGVRSLERSSLALLKRYETYIKNNPL